jgi:hypothetical protein
MTYRFYELFYDTMNSTNGRTTEADYKETLYNSTNGRTTEADYEETLYNSTNGRTTEADYEETLYNSANGRTTEADYEETLYNSTNGRTTEADYELCTTERTTEEYVKLFQRIYGLLLYISSRKPSLKCSVITRLTTATNRML